MPQRAPRACRCGRVVPGGQRCPVCSAERRVAHDRQRPSSAARGYDGEWTEARRGFLAAHPRCIRCGGAATVVDHITPHRGDKALFWSRANWQPLCAPCHNGWKQSIEARGGGRELSSRSAETGRVMSREEKPARKIFGAGGGRC